MSYSDFWVDFMTLMTTINPVAVIPLYLSVTQGMEARERTRALGKATLVSVVILLAFLIAGEPVLNTLGVTLDAFRIAGGLILLLIGLRMVFAETRNPGSRPEAAKVPHDIAVFPLAMPFIAGPGAIMSIVLLGENDLHSLPQKAGTAGTMCLVLIIVYVILRAADAIQQLLGSTGINVVARITGLVITALATQVMIIGARNLFAS